MSTYHTLSPESRVWIYQSNRPFQGEELKQVNTRLAEFARAWTSHNLQLRAYAQVHRDRFVVLMVDESQAGASGCSIDKSVHFLKQLEQEFGLDLFNRMQFAYLDGDAVEVLAREAFEAAYQEGQITDDTLVFDNLVKTKADFEAAWLKPLATSWHKRMV
ncbi:MAG: hypothetical protein KDC44_07160 [Phaeodactylibacter sp.]|nr:hypothetical protein [Phaeodactylibacter sp.]